jgi:hypothetical protein
MVENCLFKLTAKSNGFSTIGGFGDSQVNLCGNFGQQPLPMDL